MKTGWLSKAEEAFVVGSGWETALSTAVQATQVVPKDGRLYFCVIDNLSYARLDMALVHARMQHGLADNGERLIRTKLFGGEP